MSSMRAKRSDSIANDSVRGFRKLHTIHTYDGAATKGGAERKGRIDVRYTVYGMLEHMRRWALRRRNN